MKHKRILLMVYSGLLGCGAATIVSLFFIPIYLYIASQKSPKLLESTTDVGAGIAAIAFFVISLYLAPKWLAKKYNLPTTETHGDILVCGECEQPVGENDKVCPHCGAQFTADK